MQTNLKFLSFLLALLLVGCSKSQREPTPGPKASAQPPTPRPSVVFVEIPETKEQNQIQLQAVTLLTNGDYAGLEALAAK